MIPAAARRPVGASIPAHPHDDDARAIPARAPRSGAGVNQEREQPRVGVQEQQKVPSPQNKKFRPHWEWSLGEGGDQNLEERRERGQDKIYVGVFTFLSCTLYG